MMEDGLNLNPPSVRPSVRSSAPNTKQMIWNKFTLTRYMKKHR